MVLRFFTLLTHHKIYRKYIVRGIPIWVPLEYGKKKKKIYNKKKEDNL